ncbi:MAG: UvrD-helicase domain-containing protein, partial [Clostridia bacterium]|nr:UvrD-helicase domain-containing protein [Clostridia bacterium]
MKRLSKAQKDAAGHGNGTALVLSGPGSGKTTVITARAARLALSGCAGRGRLLTLTFSRAAAAEMETRYRKIIKSCPEAGGACDDFGFVFKTLHSYCAGILKKYYKKQGKHFRILADGKQKNVLIKNIYFSLNGNGDAELETHGVLAEGNTRCARGDGNTPRALNEGNAGRDRTVENIVSWVSKMKVAKSSGECFCIKDFYQKNGVEVRNFEKIYESYEK